MTNRGPKLLFADWTEEKKQELFQFMRYHSNAETAEQYGCRPSTISRYRNMYGITHAEGVLDRLKRKGINHLHRIEQEHPEVKADIIRRQTESRQKIRDRDRRRMRLGLEQKSNYELSLLPTKQRWIICAKRKNLINHGYLDKGVYKADTYYYNADTKRLRPKTEQRYADKYHIRILPESAYGTGDDKQRIITQHDYCIAGEM